MTDLENLLLPPWSRAALVHDETNLFGQPTMDALSATIAAGSKDSTGRRTDSVKINEGPADVRRWGAAVDGTTDDTEAWNDALAAMGASGGMLFVPPGVMLIEGTTDPVPGGVTVLGTGIDYSDPSLAVARASVIRAGASMQRLVQFGSDKDSSAAGDTAADARDVIFDGMGVADVVVKTAGRRSTLDHVQIYRGAEIGLEIDGQNSYLQGRSVVDQNFVGDGVMVRNDGDNKILDSELRACGVDGALVHLKMTGSSQTAGDLVITGSHLYTGWPVETESGHLIWLELSGTQYLQSFQITGNQLEACNNDQILVESGGTASVAGGIIAANQVFNVDSIDDATYSFVHLTGSGSIASMQVGPNVLRAAAADHRFRSVVHNSGAGARARIGISDNHGTYVQNIWTAAGAFSPEVGVNSVLASSTLTRRTHAVGTATFSPDGTATSFQIGLSVQGPLRGFVVTPTTPKGAEKHWVTTGGSVPGGFSSEITVVFASPPAAGSNDLVFRWEAFT